MRNTRYGKTNPILSVVLAAIITFGLFPACSGKEEKVQKAQKVRKFEPEYKIITQEKLEEWLRASEKVGEYIRRFSLKDEEVRNKNEFMVIAHSSSRTEAELRTLFDGMGLKSGEFWWIMDLLNEARLYADIKLQEGTQNLRIDVLLAAGREERTDVEKSLLKERDEAKRKEFTRRLNVINTKFSELSSLKGRTTPEKVRVEPANIELWNKNKDRVEAAIKKIWKVNEGRSSEIKRDKSIPGH